jgi:hypothetical protein
MLSKFTGPLIAQQRPCAGDEAGAGAKFGKYGDRRDVPVGWPRSRQFFPTKMWVPPGSLVRCSGGTRSISSPRIHGQKTRKPGSPSKSLRFAVNRA